ncbi:hypothetical protein ACFL59_00325 [Planctomycetota bacterium]
MAGYRPTPCKCSGLVSPRLDLRPLPVAGPHPPPANAALGKLVSQIRKEKEPPPPSKGKIIKSVRWLAQRGREGVPIRLGITVDGRAAPDGTAVKGAIFPKDSVAAGSEVETLEGKTEGAAWTTEWKYEAPEEESGAKKPPKEPEFVFKVTVEGEEAVSQSLKVDGFVELTTTHEDGKPRSVRFQAKLPDGTEREGETDEEGKAAVEPIPPGSVEIQFALYDGKPPAPTPDDVKKADPSGKNEVKSTDRFKAFRCRTGKPYKFAFEICTFDAELEIDPDDKTAADDVYTLSSTDDQKTYCQKKTIRDDKVPGDGSLTLTYTDLNPDLSYSLLVDPGAEGDPYHLFEDVPYDKLDGGDEEGK